MSWIVRWHLNCLTVTGETIGDRIEWAPAWIDRAIVRPFTDPVRPTGGLVVLFGNLAPRGAIMKRSAADPALFEREARAVVFTSLECYSALQFDPQSASKCDPGLRSESSIKISNIIAALGGAILDADRETIRTPRTYVISM